MKLNVAMRTGPQWSTIEKKKQEEQSAPYQHDRKSGYGYLSPYTEEAGGGEQVRWWVPDAMGGETRTQTLHGILGYPLELV